MKRILSFIIVLLPWKLKRILLVKFWKYDIHPNAKIGFSYIFPKMLIMKENSRIGHLNVAIHLDGIEICENSSIGRSNWITGFPSGTNSRHFNFDNSRKSELIIGEESAITKNHHLDCTNTILIGRYVTIAGYHSQFLTHSIDIDHGRQDSKAIVIGDYCFVGTNCVVLGGSNLPPRSVLGAKSLLNKIFEDEYTLYGGVPAKNISAISKNAEYFNRERGYVW